MAHWMLLQNQKLSCKEQRVLEEKRKKLKYAEERKKLMDDLDNRDEYRMPSAYDQEGNVQQDQRYKVLTERYRWALFVGMALSRPSSVTFLQVAISLHLETAANASSACCRFGFGIATSVVHIRV